MITIKTKENASLLLALAAAVIVAVITTVCQVQWWITLIVAIVVFIAMALLSLFMIKSYVAYKLKPIYSMVLSRHVHTTEIVDELKDKHVENISEELTAWADDNDKEITRLKQNEAFRKQYLGNVAHELKTPIFNIQGYISTLLDGGLEDEVINRKYLERAEKSVERMKAYLLGSMHAVGRLKIDMPRARLNIRKNAESLVVENDAAFIEWAQAHNNSLLKYSLPEIRKADAKKLVQAGERLPFVHLTRTESLTIK